MVSAIEKDTKQDTFTLVELLAFLDRHVYIYRLSLIIFLAVSATCFRRAIGART